MSEAGPSDAPVAVVAPSTGCHSFHHPPEEETLRPGSATVRQDTTRGGCWGLPADEEELYWDFG